MSIPNVKRYRITSPDGTMNAVLMAVLPKEVDVSKYLGSGAALRLESVPGSPAEAVQDPRRPAETEAGEVGLPAVYGSRARSVRRLRIPSAATSGSVSFDSVSKNGTLSLSPDCASTMLIWLFSSLVASASMD